jgi:hypothetical protein
MFILFPSPHALSSKGQWGENMGNGSENSMYFSDEFVQKLSEILLTEF